MYWRDIHRSAPVEYTAPALEPMSLVEVKYQLKISPTITDEDPWVARAIRTATRLVQADLGVTLVRTIWEMTFDQFPCERAIPLSNPPLISVQDLSSFDSLTGIETTFASSNYDVDTFSFPGRICLKPSAIWPTGARELQGGKVRWTAGYSGASAAVTSITRSGAVATVTTTTAHGFSTGQRQTIAGSDQADYNGTFEITVTGAATFTFAVTGGPVSPATGVLTVTTMGVPDRAIHMMALLITHWDQCRSAVDDDSMTSIPLGYNALGSDRLVAFG